MLDKAEHLRKNANMWRITNDLWDSWDNIMEMFSRCNEWSHMCLRDVIRIVICCR